MLRVGETDVCTGSGVVHRKEKQTDKIGEDGATGAAQFAGAE